MYPRMDDRTLIETFARSRDDAAFAAIVARYGPMVLATARRQTREAHRADDVAQAVFLILVRRAASVDGSLGTWLHRTAILASRNANRVDARRRRHEREASVERSRATTSTVDDDAMIALDAALDRLGGRDREVIALRFFESLDVAEIATRLGVHVEAAKKRLARAMTRLRRHCRGDVAVALGAIVRPSDVSFVFHPTPGSESIAKGTLMTMKHVALSKVAAASALTLAVIAGVVIAKVDGAKPQAAMASQTSATTSPASRPTSPLDAAWNDLAEREPKASIAILKLASDPDAFVAFAKDKFPPVMLTKGDLAAQLVALGNNDDAAWHGAFSHLSYFDPRVAIDLTTLFEETTDRIVRSRLAALLTGHDPADLAGDEIELSNDNFRAIRVGRSKRSWWAEPDVKQLNEADWVRGKPSWTRVVRGMVLLEHIGTPAARAIVDAMATGHPDAQPTRVARDLIAARATP